MMVLIVAKAIEVESNLVEKAVEADLESDAVDAEVKVENAQVVAVAVYEQVIMETKGTNLTLIFTAS